MTKTKTLLTIAVAIGALLVPVRGAFAVMPGANGRIAFGADSSGSFEIYTVLPDGRRLEPELLADGGSIVFRRTRPSDGLAEIETVSLYTGRFEPATSAQHLALH